MLGAKRGSTGRAGQCPGIPVRMCVASESVYTAQDPQACRTDSCTDGVLWVLCHLQPYTGTTSAGSWELVAPTYSVLGAHSWLMSRALIWHQPRAELAKGTGGDPVLQGLFLLSCCCL